MEEGGVKGRQIKEAHSKDGRVALDRIEVGDRLRPVSEAGVLSVLASVEELGILKDPIHLRLKRPLPVGRGGLPTDRERLVLIAGAHRLEVARRLGWEDIPATIWECSDDWAALMEVDDNLAGSELSPLDTAVFLVERKRIYERLHPEARAGIAGAKARWEDATDIVSFASATAEKFGITPRHVRRLMSAGMHLLPHEISQLRTAPRPATLADLQHLSKLSDNARRTAVVQMLHDGKERSAAKAVKTLNGYEQRDPEDVAFDRLVKAWSHAPRAAKARFRAFIDPAKDDRDA